MFRINVANVQPTEMAAILSGSGVQGAKILPGIGLWAGQLEECVDVVVYDEIDPERLLHRIGELMPAEEGFGLDEEFWPNPFFASLAA